MFFSQVPSVNEAPSFEPKEDQWLPVEPHIIEKIERVMADKKYYATPELTLDKLAAEVGVHHKKLSLAIKLHYKLNFYEFINGYRIGEAKRILSDPRLAHKSITDICFEVGFNSKSVFNSFFKRVEGITPRQYREKYRTVPDMNSV
jgi:AraC-like DNA-binding protein